VTCKRHSTTALEFTTSFGVRCFSTALDRVRASTESGAEAPHSIEARRLRGCYSAGNDGDTSGDFNRGSVTHSAEEESPSWQLDLRRVVAVGKIVLWNRTDCCAGRLTNFRVALFDAAGTMVHSSSHFAAGSYPDTSEKGYEIAVPGLMAQFVEVRLLPRASGETRHLSLAEVEVYPPSGVDPAPARFVRGDADSSGAIDLTDAVMVLSYLFLGGAAPACMDAADADDADSGQPTITDAIVILNWLFLGSKAPAQPSPRLAAYRGVECGPDPTPEDDIDCAKAAATCLKL